MIGTLADRPVVAGEGLPRDGLAGSGGEQAQHVPLAVGEPHDLLPALELAACEVKAELSEAHGFQRRRRGGAGAAQDAGNAQ